jgi:hypothetical protein
MCCLYTDMLTFIACREILVPLFLWLNNKLPDLEIYAIIHLLTLFLFFRQTIKESVSEMISGVSKTCCSHLKCMEMFSEYV